VAGYMKSHSKF